MNDNLKIKQSIKLELIYSYEVNKDDFKKIFPSEKDIENHLVDSHKILFDLFKREFKVEGCFEKEKTLIEAEITDNGLTKKYSVNTEENNNG